MSSVINEQSNNLKPDKLITTPVYDLPRVVFLDPKLGEGTPSSSSLIILIGAFGRVRLARVPLTK